MNVMTAMLTTGFVALLTTGAVTVAPEVLADIAAQNEAASLAGETSALGLAIGTEAEMPRSLTCVPDIATGKACASLAEYAAFPVSGDYVFALQHTATGFVLYGTTPDGAQRVAFDSEAGGITDLSGTGLNADAATGLEQTG